MIERMDEVSRQEAGARQIEVRKPEISDLPRVLELLSLQDIFHYALDPEYYVEPNSEERIRQFRDDSEYAIIHDDSSKRIRIAEINGEIVGFTTYGVIEEEYKDTKILNCVEVKELFVEESARGTGVGDRLVKEAIGLARGHGVRVKAQYSESNGTAKRFWSKYTKPSQVTAFSDIIVS